MTSAAEYAKTVNVWEAHRCPRCFRKWAQEAPEGASGRPVLHMCPMCDEEIRCPYKGEHPSNCHCNFPPRNERA